MKNYKNNNILSIMGMHSKIFSTNRAPRFYPTLQCCSTPLHLSDLLFSFFTTTAGSCCRKEEQTRRPSTPDTRRPVRLGLIHWSVPWISTTCSTEFLNHWIRASEFQKRCNLFVDRCPKKHLFEASRDFDVVVFLSLVHFWNPGFSLEVLDSFSLSQKAIGCWFRFCWKPV